MKFILILAAALMLISGCTASKISTQQPAPAPLLRQLPEAKTSAVSAGQPQGELTLVQAISLALQRNPQLSVFSLEIRAREAAALQAALLPNPELNVELENFAGNGALSAFKSTETTVSLGQLIELAGKRQKRARIAVLEGELAAWDYQTQRLNVFTQVVTAFNKVLAAQKQVQLNLDVLALAEEFKANIARRVQAGRLSPAELSRAQVEVANARIALQRSQKLLTAARLELAATWGAPQAVFKQVRGNLDQLVPLPQINKLQVLLEQNPELARWQTVTKQRLAMQDLAKAGRIPDPSINAGWRRFNDSGDQAFVAGFSIPLPFFNRNQGAVQEAAVRLNQSVWQEKSRRIALQSRLHSQYQMLLAAHEALLALKQKIIPQARQAFETINRGYQQGKFGFLDVLDARRTLFSSREAYLQNVLDYQQIRAQIERLIGQSLENIE